MVKLSSTLLVGPLDRPQGLPCLLPVRQRRRRATLAARIRVVNLLGPLS